MNNNLSMINMAVQSVPATFRSQFPSAISTSSLLKVGKYYWTRGGWKALVIWKLSNFNLTPFVVIHKPGETDEWSVPNNHHPDGRIGEPYLSVGNLSPNYEIVEHPADILSEVEDDVPFKEEMK